MTNAIRAGRTCLLSSVSNAWHSQGCAVPEAVLFVLGGGNRVDYHVEQREGVAQIFLGHHSAEIVAGFCARYAIAHRLLCWPCELEELEASLKDQLDCGNPVIAWVRMSALPYWTIPVPPGAMHAVTVEQLSGRTLTIADCYVTQGLYSTQVQTRRESLDLTRFSAWQCTDYLRHELDYRALSAQARTFRPSVREIAAGIDTAARDFLGAWPNAKGSSASLRALADDLPALCASSEPAVRQNLFRSLAYSIQHFGCLWSREFMCEVMQQHAEETGCMQLVELKTRLTASRRKWKHMIYLALKVAHLETAAREVDRLRSLLLATVDEEEAIYAAVLDLQLSGLDGSTTRQPNIRMPVAPRFGFGSNLGA